jgi:hypothetical protein
VRCSIQHKRRSGLPLNHDLGARRFNQPFDPAASLRIRSTICTLPDYFRGATFADRPCATKTRAGRRRSACGDAEPAAPARDTQKRIGKRELTGGTGRASPAGHAEAARNEPKKC